MDNIKLADEINSSQIDQSKKLTVKITYLEKRLNDRTKEEENVGHTSLNEESIQKVLFIFHMMKAHLIISPLKNQVFEPQLLFKAENLQQELWKTNNSRRK